MDPITVVPSARQMKHQALEFYGFLHFGPNTFTDREWGDGREDPAVFAPTALDADQLVLALKAAGMRGAILTCKHHDGFCLWPSRWTDHSVASSPFRGDVVRLVSDACRRHKLAFGVYLSPWDRHERTYGSGEAYNDYYVRQLTELCTGYGELFAVWLDGACGEGANGKRQRYDWARIEETVRRLQPDACISVCGPDVRWCGNEGGHTRPSEWSIVPAELARAERVSALSQHTDDASFRQQAIRSQDLDLGSREAIAHAEKLIWYPAETNTSIRPGWFYHAAEDDRVRTPEELLDLYLRSVGGNSTLLLNVPPDRRGLLHERDVEVLGELGRRIRALTARELASASLAGGAVLRVRLDGPAPVRLLMLQEDLAFSQRIESYEVRFLLRGEEQGVVRGTTVGWKSLRRVRVTADEAVLTVTACRGDVHLETFALYGE